MEFIKEEPTLRQIKNIVNSDEHRIRQIDMRKISDQLHRHHKVLSRSANVFKFKNGDFIPSATLLMDTKTIINFHVSYLLGNPVTLTGQENVVDLFSRIYKKGGYAKTDWEVLYDLVTFGNAYEYVYYDNQTNRIKSKVIRNMDSYPVYDDNGNYICFIEHWKNKTKDKEFFTVFYDDRVDRYINNVLVSSEPNLTGLPIHYAGMEKAENDIYGDSLVLDLIPIMDEIEFTLSKLSDAIDILSLNPILTVQGASVTEGDMVDSNSVGVVMKLEEGAKAEYVAAMMDYNNIKLRLDNLYQHYNMIAAVPSSILGQSNIANISEASTGYIYQLCENRGKQNINALSDGFKQRWEYMRKLTEEEISDDDFETLDVQYNITKPVDTKNNMENMAIQYNMGAVSKRTIMEKSPYTTDVTQEINRLREEGKPIEETI